ncbi:MAG TPA: glycosyltransferase family A protein [Chthonomonas sp.]|jgi:glycosyltransferase involved in cell wall biosynthesis|uniref:glycosyltransferase family 2 protein n=1 Tax=Chthonomonas sp. TaxID=2282153 RepID=UPI002B4ACA72|nr:glycosyltransferase family A protein [Chthonomonas sp.]HLH78917.1 glycosyltransferase family A protein [Chthonomonas sp.]
MNQIHLAPHYQPGLVSVIIPTYNRNHYLKMAIQSALAQTYPHIEVIVSDNCSTQNVEEVVAAFNDPRVRFRRNPTNIGPLRNVLVACKRHKGSFSAFFMMMTFGSRSFWRR